MFEGTSREDGEMSVRVVRCSDESKVEEARWMSIDCRERGPGVGHHRTASGYDDRGLRQG